MGFPFECGDATIWRPRKTIRNGGVLGSVHCEPVSANKYDFRVEAFMAQPGASRLYQLADNVGRDESSIPIARRIERLIEKWARFKYSCVETGREIMSWMIVSTSFAAVFSEGQAGSPVCANVAGEWNAITSRSCCEGDLTKLRAGLLPTTFLIRSLGLFELESRGEFPERKVPFGFAQVRLYTKQIFASRGSASVGMTVTVADRLCALTRQTSDQIAKGRAGS